MIPILYAGNEQSFLHNGLGRLSDAITCKVTEERNGTFELEMEYPVTGIHFADIAENTIIYAKTEDGGNNQAFIVYKISKPLNGVVTINAQHISYLLNGFIVFPFTALSLADAMSKIVTYTTPASIPFSFTTDVSSTAHFELSEPRSVRSLLGGESGSLLDVYGGYDYKFDNFRVSLLSDRGADRGVSIRYGKNLTGLKSTDDATNIYTGIVPYWQSENTSVYLPEKAVYCEHADDFPYKIIKTVDFSSEWEEAPTEAQLRAKAESYVANNKGWLIKNNIDVSFVSLAQTEEYKNIAPLERVKLCDTVTVIYDKLGINVKTKVIKTVYNVLLEKYDTITLGDTTYTLAKAIQQAIDAPTVAQTNSYISTAVQHATKLIQGGLGGHVVFNTDGNGEPQEILIMDTDDISTAVNVIRMNLNGIGFSHTGYDGTYETAWTIDGSFVADFITAGNLNGALISAGTVQANALSVKALDELGAVHSYIPYDAVKNASRWADGNTNAGYTISHQTITVGGETKDAIVIDGTNAAQGYDQNPFSILTDLIGTPKITVKYKYMFSSNYTASGIKLLSRITVYRSASSSSQDFIKYLTNGTTYTGGTEYEYSRTASLAYSADYFSKKSLFSIYGYRGVKVYFYDIEISSTSDVYKDSSLSFTVDGLDSVVKNGSVISSINQSAESVSISASKINLTGDLSLRGDFKSYKSGDNTTYAFLDSGNLQFWVSGDIGFTVASNLYNGFGIFFGDSQDVQAYKYTVITKDEINTRKMYIGDGGTGAGATQLGFDGLITDKCVYLYRDGSLGYSGTGTFTRLAVEGGIEAQDFTCDGNILIRGDGLSNSAFWTPVTFHKAVKDDNGSTIFVSDQRKKRSIKDLAIEKARSFIMALKPKEFKFKKDISTSDRKHHGFIAQEVKEAMWEDWGLYCEDEKEDYIGLRYIELIADMVAVIQDQEKRIDALERGLHDITNNKP